MIIKIKIYTGPTAICMTIPNFTITCHLTITNIPTPIFLLLYLPFNISISWRILFSYKGSWSSVLDRTKNSISTVNRFYMKTNFALSTKIKWFN